MFRLGRPFLQQYYKILIDEGSSIILCSTGADGKLLGFVSGSLDAGSRNIALKKHLFRLAWSALPAMVRNPGLIAEILKRKNADSPKEGGAGYVFQSGAHEEFWAYLPGHGGDAIELHLKWLAYMALLGVEEVLGEVDKVNVMVAKTHRLLGARVVRTFHTPDGRERTLIKYSLRK